MVTQCHGEDSQTSLCDSYYASFITACAEIPLWKGLVLLLIKPTKETSIQQRNTNEGNTSKLTLSIVSLWNNKHIFFIPIPQIIYNEHSLS